MGLSYHHDYKKYDTEICGNIHPHNVEVHRLITPVYSPCHVEWIFGFGESLSVALRGHFQNVTFFRTWATREIDNRFLNISQVGTKFCQYWVLKWDCSGSKAIPWSIYARDCFHVNLSYSFALSFLPSCEVSSGVLQILIILRNTELKQLFLER